MASVFTEQFYITFTIILLVGLKICSLILQERKLRAETLSATMTHLETNTMTHLETKLGPGTQAF